jgi:hypothetical protein
MRSTTWLFLAVSCSFATGCLGDLFKLQLTPDDAPEKSFEYPNSKFPQCLGVEDPVDDEMFINNNLDGPPAAGFTGHEEVAQSKLGCIRWYRDVVNGAVTSEGMVMARGFVEVFTELDGGIGAREAQRYLSRQDYSDHGSRLEIDRNGDGFLESVTIEDFDGDGFLNRVSTYFSETTGQIQKRQTVHRVDADTLRWTEEVQVDGALKVVKDENGRAEMKAQKTTNGACYGHGGHWDMPCTQEEKDKIRKYLLEMLPQAQKCLRRARWGENKGLPGSGKDMSVLEHHIKGQAQQLLTHCFEGDDAFASMEGISKDIFGTKVLSVNAAMLRCETPNFIKGKLFHEVLHITRGQHDEDVVNLGDKMSDEAYTYSDPMRACDELCFGEIKTKCSCAVCLDTLACDPVCSDLPSCRKDDANGFPIMSEAVGSVCKMPGGIQGGTHWNATYAACESTCKGGTCKTFSVSCSPACN